MNNTWESFQEADGSRSYPLRGPIRPRTRWTQYPGRLSQHHSPFVANRSWFQQPTFSQSFAYTPMQSTLLVEDTSPRGREASVIPLLSPTPPGIDMNSSRYPPVLNPTVLPTNILAYPPAAYATFSQAPPDSHLNNPQRDPSSVSPFWVHQSSLIEQRGHDEQSQSTSTHIGRRPESYFGQSSDLHDTRQPVMQHKVFKIHCVSCNTFLSDRGMKVRPL